MHRLPLHMTSRQRARPHPQPGRLVVGVVLDLACKLCTVIGLGALAMALTRAQSLTDWSGADRTWGLVFLIALASYIFLAGWRYYHGKRTLCSLCRGSVFHVQHSTKNRDATKWPGVGYRTSAVLSLFFTGRYNCMYCGTPFRLKK
ncbi:MAG: hypothetical protein ACKV19_04850 [Verrucomicrobiales bacterium]